MRHEYIEFKIEDYQKYRKKKTVVDIAEDRKKQDTSKKIVYPRIDEDRSTTIRFIEKSAYPKTEVRKRKIGYVRTEPD